MDDTTRFDRQLSAGFASLMGPSEPVDDAAIFDAIASPRSGGWVMGSVSLYSAVRFFVAAAIVAASGAFLVQGVLQTPSPEQRVPAAATESPSPKTTGPLRFPTGTFVTDEEGLSLELRPDGTCRRLSVDCTYGVNGDLFSEMTFDEPSGAQVPATYHWQFDGEELTFEPWGEDLRPTRRDGYADRVYRPVGETEPLPDRETVFPTGWFTSTDGSGVLSFGENGTYAGDELGGKYAVNGELFTAMTFTRPNTALVPATYQWDWDGERLTFRLWGEDDNPWRTAQFLGHVFVRDASATVLGAARRLFLSDPRIGYFISVEIQEQADGSFTATTDVEGDRSGDGVGATPQAAVEAALKAMGEPLASELAEKVTG